ncbi:MAG TPA: BON domain-containing protein [Ktedonobacterales bacterium]
MEQASTTTMAPALAPTDVELQQQVLDELAWGGRVRPSEIGVAAHDGIVTLGGGISSYLACMAAQEATHRVRGVRAIWEAAHQTWPSGRTCRLWA